MRVFIGSSKERRKMVEWLTAFIRDEYGGKIEPVPWTVPWTGGQFLLENLLGFIEETDAAILFWTPDDKTWYRDSERHEPRDNLVFEAGLFIASHGRARTQLMIPENVGKKVALPSDVSGLTLVPFAWQDGPEEATGLPKAARAVCENLLSLGPRPRASGKLAHLKGLPGIEEARTFVGDWRSIHINAIAHLAKSPEAQEIDVLAAYRIGEIRNVIGEFKKRPNAKLRVCFADVFDKALCEAYRRKYYNRTAEEMEFYLKESIQLLLSPCKILVENGNITVTELQEPPNAQIEIRLTSHRITFSYYRINEISFLVPLDMKKNKEPSPLVWAVEKETVPVAYQAYLNEYNAVFEEARRVNIQH